MLAADGALVHAPVEGERVTLPSEPLQLVCFDVDGTLVDGLQFIWELLHDHFQTDPERRRAAYDAYFADQITYEEWAQHDLALLKVAGATKAKMQEAMSPLYPMDGCREVLRILKQRGIKLAVVSGSLEIALEHVLPDYRDWFDDVFINRFLFDETGNLASIEATPFDIHHKATALRRLSERERIPLSSIGFVGDNFNDVEAAKVAGFSVAFNCRSVELADVCDVEVPGKDLRKILPHLLPED